jgi:hypothetical protein
VAASLHTVVIPQWPSRPLISTPADRVQSLKTLFVLDLPRSILTVQIQNPHKPKKNCQNIENTFYLETLATCTVKLITTVNYGFL